MKSLSGNSNESAMNLVSIIILVWIFIKNNKMQTYGQMKWSYITSIERETILMFPCILYIYKLSAAYKLILFTCYHNSDLQENLSERFAITNPAKTWNKIITSLVT